ncbi:MAG: hypothetical protein AAF605_00765 [Myxococcota bacterium]
MERPIESQRVTPKSGSTRTFPCESCGADLTFNIGIQRLKCDFCGHEKDLLPSEAEIRERGLKSALRDLRRQTKPAVATESSIQLDCSSCGAKVVFEGAITSRDCPYCATPTQRSDVHQAEERLVVDAVLPFAVDETKAISEIAGWVRSRWFAPSVFKKRGATGKIDGVFLPYFTFDAMTVTDYQGQRGDNYTVTVGSGEDRRTERRTRWSRRSGRFQRFFDDVLCCGASAVEHRMVDALEPWPLPQLRPYDPAILAGKTTMTYDLELEQVFEQARARMQSELRDETKRRIGGDRQRIDALESAFSALTFKHLMLPVWILAYRFRERSYRVFVNACTGEVQGSRPYSWIKITLAVLAGLAVVGAGFLLQRSQS